MVMTEKQGEKKPPQLTEAVFVGCSLADQAAVVAATLRAGNFSLIRADLPLRSRK
jgi:hypothetical protein